MKEIELMNHRAIIEIPENSVEITIHAKVFHNGEVIEVANVLDMEAIRESFRKADDGYIDDDDVFFLTEKGKEHLEEERKSGRLI